MGGDNKSLTTKCGEILIHLKTNKKTKVYTYNCAFCKANYDQLKKFSFHLDEKHSENIYEPVSSLATKIEEQHDLKDEQLEESELTTETLIPDIKVEELIDIGHANVCLETVLESKLDNEGEDPLLTRTSSGRSMVATNKASVKCEQDEDESGEGEDDNTLDFNLEVEDDYEFADSVDGSGLESGEDESNTSLKDDQKERNTRKKRVKKRYGSDVDTDDSRDADFDLEVEVKKHKRKYRKCLPKPKPVITVDEKLLISAILESLQTQPILWNVKNRSQEISVRQNAYETITRQVNEKLQVEVRWQDVRKSIQEIRNNAARELEKQQKGEEFEVPWYAESIKFLNENIEVLVKHRSEVRKYKRLKTMDESHIPILIEYYKNCDILWQVTNIAFVVKPKKLDALKVIIQDLKENHDINITIEGMQKRINYINRIYSTNRELELKCEADNTEFVANSKYYRQLSFLRDSEGPFRCPHCSKIIHKFETYHIHIGEHTNTAPFKCVLCEMGFSKLAKYIIHAKRHLGVHNYHCDVCGKGYPFRAELDWHYREHTGEEPFLCEICGASFRSRNGHDNHVRRHENRFRYACHICKHGFNHLHALNSHVKVHLNIRDILCNVCGKGFTARKYLVRHMEKHTVERNYKCLVCGKAFAQDAGLRAHRRHGCSSIEN